MKTVYELIGLTIGVFIFALLAMPVTAQEDDWAENNISMQQLLQQVKEGRARDTADNRERERAFITEKEKQEARIHQVIADIASLEVRSTEMEEAFNDNELLIEEKRRQRDERLGSLKDLFGHLTAAAGDLRSRFRSSITSSQFFGREEFLSDLIKKTNSDSDLPGLNEIEQFWYELHREMTESGRVVKYPTTVGIDQQREVVRIGLFNLVSDGDYLAYDEGTRSVSVLPRQPPGLADGARTLQVTSEGIIAVGIDPTGAVGGGFLKAIIYTPTLKERWHQGRQVGYIITGIAVFAVLIVLWRFLVLSLIAFRIKKQLRQQEIRTDNPLGRLLKVAQDNNYADLENLELKLAEATLKEVPAIHVGLSLLKIIAMVAPLLGLLGTVTGMIIVFQSITIYGAGDPQAMAGGISSALVTTVLGLLVAVPSLLFHTILYDKARKLIHILEEQSAGIIVERIGR